MMIFIDCTRRILVIGTDQTDSLTLKGTGSAGR